MLQLLRKAWAGLVENKLFVIGTAISTLLLEVHLAAYHHSPNLERAMDSVVLIATESGTGSGFFIDQNGCAMTAGHVVDGAHTVRFLVRGERVTRTAVVVAENRQLDMAIVCTPMRPKSWFSIRQTEGVHRGDHVWAIGHPWGRTWNVTDGIISRTGYKDHTTDGKNFYPLYDLWVSCFISWGNSGGPVIDADGYVVGMIIEFDTPGIDHPNNMNIAVPGTEMLRFIRMSEGR